MSVANIAGGVTTPAQFIAKWSQSELSERAASHEHFIDLCRLLGQPTPAEHDATGAEYTFEKSVAVTGGASRGSKGERGFADVWWKNKFAWEYKRKGRHSSLEDAYRQLCQYREALDNPPLLIVSDIARIEIHTNFTGTKKEIHALTLAELDAPDALAKLRRAFTDPASFEPKLTTAKITEDAAGQFAAIADGLRARRHEPHAAAHFLMKCMFCLFAEDVRLLPAGLFKRLLDAGQGDPAKLTGRLTALFNAMRSGGDFGAEDIAWFNGGLFDDAPALDLQRDEIAAMRAAAEQDWGAVEPAIFGTLFERSLDPGKRAQIGAHYTSRDDILLIVEPVVMVPLRREWRAVQEQVESLIDKRRQAATKQAKKKADDEISKAIEGFLDRLASLRILDPACGSGNFLYVAIQQLLNLEKEVITFAARPDIGQGLFPRVRPTQLHGLELNAYAAELAQVVIWIGYLQWMRDNGFNPPRDPILEPLQTIQCRDAILDLSPSPSQGEGRGEGVRARPATWPAADFIIGNPPFLGDKLMRGRLGDEYVDMLRLAYSESLPGQADYCCYWFEGARNSIQNKPDTRAGLLATQNIRGGASRTVLERIKESGDIFFAISDRDWILEGANVHVSLVGFDDGTEQTRTLNGSLVKKINANLNAGADLTAIAQLPENSNLGFIGSCKGGPFDIDHHEARQLLRLTGNPHGRPNTDVLRPVMNSEELTGRKPLRWIIDNAALALEEACKYEAPHALVEKRVKPIRSKNRDKWLRENWWRPQRMRVEMRAAIRLLSRYLATLTTSKHRILQWLPYSILPDHQLVVFARADDYFFGVLHGAIHELWARRTGTQLREVESGFRYTPSTCFETFPLPWPPGKEPPDHPAQARIAAAAKSLNEQRERWLNPPEWIEPLAAMIDAKDNFSDVPADARPLVRQSAIQAAAATDPRLKKRTLTNLYNERPTWLRLAHEQLDRAALAAYAATDPAGGWAEDWAAVWVETGAGQPLPADHPLAARRKEIDERVLANLLRLNLDRAGRAAAAGGDKAGDGKAGGLLAALEPSEPDAEPDAADEPAATPARAKRAGRAKAGRAKAATSKGRGNNG